MESDLQRPGVQSCLSLLPIVAGMAIAVPRKPRSEQGRQAQEDQHGEQGAEACAQADEPRCATDILRSRVFCGELVSCSAALFLSPLIVSFILARWSDEWRGLFCCCLFGRRWLRQAGGRRDGGHSGQRSRQRARQRTRPSLFSSSRTTQHCVSLDASE